MWRKSRVASAVQRDRSAAGAGSNSSPCRIACPGAAPNPPPPAALHLAEGVLYAEKDFNLPEHPEIDVPNLEVIKLMQVGVCGGVGGWVGGGGGMPLVAAFYCCSAGGGWLIYVPCSAWQGRLCLLRAVCFGTRALAHPVCR